MAVTTLYQPYFIGRVRQNEYAQQFDFEFEPLYTIVTRDGVEVSRYISSYRRDFVTARVVEQTFVFEGLTRTLAFGVSDITVADLDGNEYTIPLKSRIVDGSTGSRVMIVEEVSVHRTPISPRMWQLAVTRRGFIYYVNGTAITLPNTPAWIGNFI